SVVLVRDVQAGNVASDARTRIAKAAARRAGPVLTSCAVVAAALLPALALGDLAGLELLRPFAASALGSLVATLVAVLLLVPALSLAAGIGPHNDSSLGSSAAGRPSTVLKKLRWRRS
ncbi:MAG: hypothetical protein ACHP7G_10050, partial [Actinomycetales bacterium]